MRRLLFLLLTSYFLLNSIAAQETQRLYLSGTGCDDMVEWDFKCTDGRQSGEWTKIGVPSCWELQGFGTYQYGMRFYGKATPEGIADEKGLYKTEFTLPQEWQGRQILLVFEAVFTDANVTINGRKAGKGLYQGGFTRHTIDVSDRVFFGTKKNRLEVEVSKESANPQVNMAERRADYWNFGGIWRPVFIVSKPMQNISRVAINAKADGRFQADVFLSRALPFCQLCVDIVDANGKKATSPAITVASDQARLDFTVKTPKLWTAETPNLYTAVFTLKDAQGKTLHVERQKFGFRTIEYRHSYNGDDGDGVFINGQKVIFKGVNRHSFRPETGRTLSKAKNIEDVKLIKSMNMNAVRLSHYPADPEFLDACDSLGLYVECELPGWHNAHETIVGTQIAEEMVTRDVNHPSIIFWSNGNEGGFNYELEPVFTRLDPQQRVVLYPWANRNGFETKHYRSWGETAEYMRQKEIFMPTEFLHGLYDGGHGAGLKDYWQLMLSNPRCAGGFLWDLQDQAVLRTDWSNSTQPNSQLSTLNSQLSTLNPQLSTLNSQLSTLNPQLSTLNSQLSTLNPQSFFDPVGNFGSDGIVGPHMEKEGSYYTIKEVWSPIQIELKHKEITVRNAYDFINLKDCRLRYCWMDLPFYGGAEEKIVSKGIMTLPSAEPGESVTLALPEGNGAMLELTATDPYGQDIMSWRFLRQNQYPTDWIFEAIQTKTETDEVLTVTAGVGGDLQSPTTYTFSKKDGRLLQVKTAKHTYSLTGGPRFVAAKRADRSDDGFYNHDDKEAFQKKTQYTTYKDQGTFAGFELNGGQLTVRYRHGSLQTVKWHFLADGSAVLSAEAGFNGVVDLMGICFDYPEDKVQSKRWVGRGPYRVWQNRMEGPQYGYYVTAYNDPIPGESWQYPEFKGYFADVQWMQLQTTEGAIGIQPCHAHQRLMYIGVYTPRDGRDHLLYDLPQTGIALLDVIPAVRNKVNTTDLNGPSAQPHFAQGTHVYEAWLRFD
ncbi:MAG: DUF4981 domain-containing protein [Prevotella sp.]|nr:DUF4981 domain-containing protein [Prevotella sp.]